MNAILLLPAMLEFLLVSIALVGFCRIKISAVTLFAAVSWLVFFSTFLVIIPSVSGGVAATAMSVKVFFFLIAIAYAIKNPRAARWWLLTSVVVSLVAQAFAGNVLNKLSTVPFLLIACFWVLSRISLGLREVVAVTLFLIAELIQAFVLESRGLILSVGIAICFLIIPLKLIRFGTILIAILLPIVYPFALTLIFDGFLSDSNVINATSSNFERSAMAAWCVNNIFLYPFNGPGGILFADEVNAMKLLGEQAVADAYDPHHFLLSAWVWLGSFAILMLYAIWCLIWIYKAKSQVLILNQRIKIFAVIATTGIITFTLSPPDSTARVQVAMLVGIAIAGLRDPLILLPSCKTLEDS